MGREIRRVPANWDHPKSKERINGNEEYQPMYDRDYETEMAEWIENHHLWLKGEHPDQVDGSGIEHKYFAQWDGNPPEVEYYHPKWAEGEATWYQLYETVSEGTPISPPFATEDELIHYLMNYGDFWYPDKPYSREAAERMVKGGWAPSLIIAGGKMYQGAEGLAAISRKTES